MPLIIKGQENIISKKEMKKKIANHTEEKGKDALSDLPAEVAERRREILEAKKHREFMEKIAKAEAEKKVTVTEELVVEAKPEVIEPVVVAEPKSEEVDFESMSKRELAEWSESNIGMDLDRRKTKAQMIEIIKNNL